MESLVKAYSKNPAILNQVAVVVMSLIIHALETPGGLQAAAVAMLALASGALTRSQVTPVIDGQRKIITEVGHVNPIP